MLRQSFVYNPRWYPHGTDSHIGKSCRVRPRGPTTQKPHEQLRTRQRAGRAPGRLDHLGTRLSITAEVLISGSGVEARAGVEPT